MKDTRAYIRKVVSEFFWFFFRRGEKFLCQIRCFLGQIAIIIKIYFETKSACEMLLEMKIYKKYAILQQTQQREVNKTDDFYKKHR